MQADIIGDSARIPLRNILKKYRHVILIFARDRLGSNHPPFTGNFFCRYSFIFTKRNQKGNFELGHRRNIFGYLAINASAADIPRLCHNIPVFLKNLDGNIIRYTRFSSAFLIRLGRHVNSYSLASVVLVSAALVSTALASALAAAALSSAALVSAAALSLAPSSSSFFILPLNAARLT